jgi:hypothetical protein
VGGVTPAERIAELEAQRAAALEEENARLREFNALLTDALERTTGLRLPHSDGQRDCRVLPPPRRCRPGGRRAW